MFKRFIKPNWKRSNLNVSATLAEFLGAPNDKDVLPILKKELLKGYKNVVFICFDGLGIYPIKVNLKRDEFLRKNLKMVLRSTFPSTTTNATTSLSTNKLPLEHGWLGWSMYFEDIDRSIDIYTGKDSLTKEPVEYVKPLYDNSDDYFHKGNGEYEITHVAPIYAETKYPEKKIVVKDEIELCRAIKSVTEREGKQFIYSYISDPDSTMHREGVRSEKAKAKIASINREVEKLSKSLSNTLIIVTADHGQIDVKDYVEFYKDEEMNALLKCPPYLEARAPAFRVKEGKEREFEVKFKKKYGKDFKLYKSSYLIKKGYFGDRGEYGNLLGDYVAIGTYTHKQFMLAESMPRFKGHHTSLTEEMLVPLIMIKCK